MIRNYFITTIRNLWRNKIFSFINIVGLALGLAICITIYLFVENELSFDNYHNDTDRIYRVTHTIEFSSGKDIAAITQYPFASMVKEKLTGYENVARVVYTEQTAEIDNQKFNEDAIIFTSNDFFKIFKQEWVQGNEETALKDLNTAIVTESIAKSYFNGDAIGKSFKLADSVIVVVTGVIKDSPSNTHLPIKFLISEETYTERITGYKFDNWITSSGDFYTYVKLLPSTTKEQFEKLIDKEKRNFLNEKWIDKEFYYLQPLNDIHTNGTYMGNNRTYTTPIKYLYTFSIIGMFILILACINFINLSTAQSVKRSKEVGIRKAVGGTRSKLFQQFMLETAMLTFISIIVAVIITEIFISKVNALYDNNISLSVYNSGSVFYFIGIIFVLVTFAAGAYPAIVLSSFNPIKSLTNKLNSHKKQSLIFRNLLVTLQFTVSLALIIGTIVIYRQLNYMMHKELGFETENIVSVQLPDNFESNDKERFRNLLLKNPEIINISYCFSFPTDNSRYGSFIKFDKSTDEKHLVFNYPADEHYPNLFKLKLLEGRWFQDKDKNDTIDNVVINEVAMKMMNASKPSEVIGTKLDKKTRIVGVAKNFHNLSLHDKISPIMLFYDETELYDVAINYHESSKEKVSEVIKSAWDDVFPGEVFGERYFEDVIGAQYENEKRTVNIIQVFAVLAILIACLGVFGLISFLIINKTKEIGVRKVFGAKAGNIIYLVSKNYIRLILISTIISVPLSWYFLNNWLDNFAYKATIDIWPFISALIVISSITLLVMSFYLLKAIRMNPSRSLKYE